MSGQVAAEHGVVYRHENGLFGYFGWPTVARLGSGALAAGGSGFRLGHVCPFGKSALFWSRDGGRTWSPPVVVNDRLADDRDVGLLALGGDRLLMSWFSVSYETYREAYMPRLEKTMAPHEYALCGALVDAYEAQEARGGGGSFARVSGDGGLSWGPVRRVPVTSPHGPCLLADGTLLYLGKEFGERE